MCKGLSWKYWFVSHQLSKRPLKTPLSIGNSDLGMKIAQELIPWATQISSLMILINPCWQTRFESIEIICNKILIVYLVSSGKFWVALNLYGKDSIDFWNQNSYHLKAILPWVVITYGVLFSLLSNVWSEGMYSVYS